MDCQTNEFRLPDGSVEISRIRVGSYLYGTNHELSDTDIQSVFWMPAGCDAPEYIVRGPDKPKNTRNKASDIDFKGIRLDVFLQKVIQGDIFCVETLFAPPSVYLAEPHETWQKIIRDRHLLIGKNSSGFRGLMKTKAMMYGATPDRIQFLKSTADWWETNLGSKYQKVFELLPAFQLEMRKELDQSRSDWTASAEIVARNDHEYLSICQIMIDMNENATRLIQQCRTAASRYENVRENPKPKYLRDIAHAFRMTNQIIELLEYGKITFPRPTEEIEKIFSLRSGDQEMVLSQIDRIARMPGIIPALQMVSQLPDEGSQDVVKSILDEINGLENHHHHQS